MCLNVEEGRTSGKRKHTCWQFSLNKPLRNKTRWLEAARVRQKVEVNGKRGVRLSARELVPPLRLSSMTPLESLCYSNNSPIKLGLITASRWPRRQLAQTLTNGPRSKILAAHSNCLLPIRVQVNMIREARQWQQAAEPGRKIFGRSFKEGC